MGLIHVKSDLSLLGFDLRLQRRNLILLEHRRPANEKERHHEEGGQDSPSGSPGPRDVQSGPSYVSRPGDVPDGPERLPSIVRQDVIPVSRGPHKVPELRQMKRHVSAALYSNGSLEVSKPHWFIMQNLQNLDSGRMAYCFEEFRPRILSFGLAGQ